MSADWAELVEIRNVIKNIIGNKNKWNSCFANPGFILLPPRPYANTVAEAADPYFIRIVRIEEDPFRLSKWIGFNPVEVR